MSDANDALKAGGVPRLEVARAKAKARKLPPADPPADPLGAIRRFVEGQVAQAFVERHRERLRFTKVTKQWVAFDGRRWVQEDDYGAAELLRAMAMDYYLEAAVTADDGERGRIRKRAEVLDRAKSRRGVLDLARGEPGFRVDPDVFDRDPWLLNVENGTLDLRDGKVELRPHRPDDFLRKLAPVEYHPDAKAPTWEAFLRRIIVGKDADGSDELIGYLQRLAGYALTGTIREHVFPVFYGTGGNGKGTFLGTLGNILGDYMVPLPEGMLLHRKHTPHPAELMTLRGARLAVSSEINKDGSLNESRVKALTGGDRIQARGMHQDFSTGFAPTAKIVLAVNHRPQVRDTSAGMWRRMNLVPFEQTITEDEMDGTLDQKLKAEAPGILAWAVRGCMEWQRIGLAPPEAVRHATATYQEESDFVGRWVRERCNVARDLSAPFASLYSDFEDWLKDVEEEEGVLEEPINRRAFGQRLDALGHRSKAGKNNQKRRQGIALCGEPDPRFGNDD
jgi:putative DNA primase/helicase